MSIEINYKGRIGNHLFQYVFARLLAIKNNLFLKTKWDFPKLIKSTKHENGKVFKFPIKIISDDINCDPEFKEYNLDKPLGKAKYILDGYFENSNFFNKNEKLIKSFFILNKIEKNTEDIVINLRLGDFGTARHPILHPKFYLDILEKETFKKLYIVGSRPDEPYLKFFRKYGPIIVPTHPINDFHFIRKFDKIICSNSTYCWWAAFLSEANHIYTPDKWGSPLLGLCKNSIPVKRISYNDYKPKTYYDIGYLEKYKLLKKIIELKVKILRLGEKILGLGARILG